MDCETGAERWDYQENPLSWYWSADRNSGAKFTIPRDTLNNYLWSKARALNKIIISTTYRIWGRTVITTTTILCHKKIERAFLIIKPYPLLRYFQPINIYFCKRSISARVQPDHAACDGSCGAFTCHSDGLFEMVLVMKHHNLQQQRPARRPAQRASGCSGWLRHVWLLHHSFYVRHTRNK